MTTLPELLHPSRFTEMSGRMSAIVAYILGEHWTEPTITDIAITSDGYLLFQLEGDIGHNDFIGPAIDLERNWACLLIAADLTPDQRTEANTLYDSRITDHRQVPSC